MSRFSSVILLGTLLATAALLYWPGMHGGFVFDDFPNLVANETLRASVLTTASLRDAALSSDSGPLARPLTMLTFALQIAVTGESVVALKLGNLAIHLANGLLVFFLTHAIVAAVVRAPELQTRAEWMPYFVAAAWLLAPINLTAVLYVVQRMESLSTLFVLLGLLGYLQGRQMYARGCQFGFIWMAISIVVTTSLASLSKETGVLLPAFAFVLEWALFGLRRSDGTQIDAKLALLFVLTLLLPGVFGVAATLPAAVNGASYAARPFTLSERLFTEARVVVDYVSWILLPDLQELSLYHDDYLLSYGWLSPPSTLISVCGILGATIVAIRMRSRRPMLAAGIAFFLTGHSLVSTYLPLELVFEHRNYLPSFGIFLALFDVLLIWATRRSLRIAGLSLSAGLVGLSGFVLHLRANEWSVPATLALIEASRHPESLRANYELGRMYGEQALDPGSPSYSFAIKSFDSAARLPGGGVLPLQASLQLAARFGQPVEPELWSRIRTLVASGPLSSQDVTALHSLIACARSGQCQFEANALGGVLATAADKNPARPDILTQYADYAINLAGDYALGLSLMQRAVAVAPRNHQYWVNLVTLQIAAGRLDEALRGIARLRELDRFGSGGRSIAELEASLQQRAAQPSEMLQSSINR